MRIRARAVAIAIRKTQLIPLPNAILTTTRSPMSYGLDKNEVSRPLYFYYIPYNMSLPKMHLLVREFEVPRRITN